MGRMSRCGTVNSAGREGDVHSTIGVDRIFETQLHLESIVLFANSHNNMDIEQPRYIVGRIETMIHCTIRFLHTFHTSAFGKDLQEMFCM